jgi:riboflavin biosynthesis pyrimidine reductase
MGLLRAAADAVVVGMNTFEVAGHDTLWFPESTYPPAKKIYAHYRKEILKKQHAPLLAIVTARGKIDFSFSVFHEPRQRVLILTTERGKKAIAKRMPRGLRNADVVAVSKDSVILPEAIVKLLRKEYKVELLLNEGGPTLFGGFLSAGVMDELFLTVAPQIAGRGKQPRIALVEGAEFLPGRSPWWTLKSARQAGNHLFLRYRIDDRKK